MKYVNLFGLRDGMQGEYKRRHDEIWPEMKEMMLAGGIKNYTIWNTGTMLVEYFECDDLGAARKITANSLVKKRWDEYMKDILVFDDETGKMMPLTCMFDFNPTR
jgi:L-rhamnose mutarotase